MFVQYLAILWIRPVISPTETPVEVTQMPEEGHLHHRSYYCHIVINCGLFFNIFRDS